MKGISFCMQGRFAHFCIPFTNVYRLTQPCPTKTAIMGFIGAVLGMDKDDLSLYQKYKCGIEIVNEYRTIAIPYLARQGFSGTSSNNDSSRTSVEVIVNPKYKIYLLGDEKYLIQIQKLLSSQEPYYTPYLGLVQFFASTDFEVSNLVNVDFIEEGVDVNVNGAFIRGVHGELDFSRLTSGSIRLTEFHGIKGISQPRKFEHGVFTINLDAGTIPLKNARQIVKISEWKKYVPIF